MDKGKNKIITKRIKVFGIVQGVGFRPLVYRIARKYNIKGTVCNVGGYAEINAQATEQEINTFMKALMDGQSGGCEITKIETEDVSDKDYSDFKIIHSKEDEEISIIPPDLPVCPDCERELYTKQDRRFLNPFISCMSCGPRYTIMEELPYDRDNTTMMDFTMCPECNREYTSPNSRRFHAQTISCNDCGPYLIYRRTLENGKTTNKKTEGTKSLKIIYDGEDKEKLTDREALKEAVDCIKAGGIIAVKGIGGYHFVCSPFMEDTVTNLRKLKGREEKPFAVMFPSIEAIRNYCNVSKEEEELLLSKARPIVLLYAGQYKKDSMTDKADVPKMAPSTNKESMYIGAFLPYTPLQIILIQMCGPLIMTSANPSERPVIKEDEEILSPEFAPFLNGVLYNKRRILRSVDDSVAKIMDGKAQLIRRSRGYVPYPVFIGYQGKGKPQIFAAGGDLKAAFCLYKGGNAVVSQYFGDLEESSVMETYDKSFSDLKKLFKITPDLAVCDLHPNYHSTAFTKKLRIPVLEVQHHHAHIASVMAEHAIKEKVIGIAFDGTGYGTDGTIWGGEFLICEGAGFLRAAHLQTVPIIGGDSSMKDAKKTASCFLMKAGLEEYIRDERKDMIQAAIRNKINTVHTSSMGRLFDAVASILELKQENQYEGECAALLEREAVIALNNHVKVEELSFAITKKSGIIEMESEAVLRTICEKRDSVSTGSLALGFHYAVSDVINRICMLLKEEYQTNMVVLCGGVFQNTVLSQRTINILRDHGFRVYINRVVPPNDGSISLGQTYIGLCHMENQGKETV